MMQGWTKTCEDETALLGVARAFAQVVKAQGCAVCVYLNGELGAGKTTFSRGVVQALGHDGNVKSPTYTLVEEYHLSPLAVFHFDLYRLADPEELEFMGIRDYFDAHALCLIEWPAKGECFINPPDVVLDIAYQNTGRRLTFTPQNALGAQIVCQLAQIFAQ
ncbi:tRNA (adenosine(37)-N6)-threonylcarbamoyltransferase complex ATPase subunit type 1 TsaE [Spirabiliibacterium mucosae]|uniref:tRNA (adenosine(37)-N6)-threonylcarbamoyltransferase complex ATPase subunit type 1 TsaE n=1 Tax=Spirabiliibacterium mucosae TaxID=28156 RepID=UPI001AADAD8C